ncbi:MAG: sulfate transporter CysZ [Succinivibrio sp.]|nr:sulfate transporter CysZ [Succinivibrio sp.]
MIQESQESIISPGESLKLLGDGLKIALSKECRLYIIVPIIFNFFILTAVGLCLYYNLTDFVNETTSGLLPDWLSFLAPLVEPLIAFLLAALIIFLSVYFFSTLATVIASPFYGLLADKVEKMLNNTQSEDLGFKGIIRDIPRIIKREIRKQLFFWPRALLCCVVSFIPVINAVAPLCWFLLSAWMCCLQYTDYAYDNHKISFMTMRHDLAANKTATVFFGGIIAVGMIIPVLNLLLPPAAVCAGTKYYLLAQKHYVINKEL